ncbi:unnamed protein product [Dibothriocephalus latus]|uniref:Uncharacterized protein n=1 Tax=Dibothriocephalus latus TaxID=60516 RepID=A0A3P6RBI7_DIBLA|nr:unnamed protein product [Dibothriocephalus latus]
MAQERCAFQEEEESIVSSTETMDEMPQQARLLAVEGAY